LDFKLFKKTYPYVCVKCGEFAHTKYDFCDKCGASDTLRKADKEDYRDYIK
jgi:rRNA maturation endonuclease Nob1